MTKTKSALNSACYGLSQRGFVDYDYCDKLDDESKAWLEKFTAEYYGGVFVEPTLHNQEQKREIWRTKKRRSSDMMSSGPSPIKEDVIAENVAGLNPRLLVMAKELEERKAKW